MSAAYLIRPVVDADLALVAGWRARPHVTEWWGEPDVEPEADKLADPNIDLWLVAHAGRPFAFIQDYRVHAWDPHPFRYLPDGARGLDLFVGEPDMLDQGHGQAFLRQHVEALFARGVPAGVTTHTLRTCAPAAPTKRPVSSWRADRWTPPGAARC